MNLITVRKNESIESLKLTIDEFFIVNKIDQLFKQCNYLIKTPSIIKYLYFVSKKE